MLQNTYQSWMAKAEDKEVVLQADIISLTEHAWARLGITPAEVKEQLPRKRTAVCYTLCSYPTWDTENSRQQPIPGWEIIVHSFYLRSMLNKVMENPKSFWLDVGPPAYRELYWMYLRDRLERLPGLDYLVLDYWHPYLRKGRLGQFTLDKPIDGYANDEAWTEAWKAFIEYLIPRVRSQFPKLLIIGNNVGMHGDPDPMREWDRSFCDSVIYESFSVGWKSEDWAPEEVERRINCLRDDPLEVWAADYGIRTELPRALYEQKRDFSLAMFLMGLPMPVTPRVRPQFSLAQTGAPNIYAYAGTLADPGPLRSWNVYHDGTKPDMAYAGLDLGLPVEEARKPGPGKWERHFENGIVYLNTRDETWTTLLATGYKVVGGQSKLAALDILPHTGLILAKEE